MIGDLEVQRSWQAACAEATGLWFARISSLEVDPRAIGEEDLVNESMKRVLGALTGVKRQGKGWLALCPAHDDHNPSLNVNYADDGETVVTYCQVGCSQDAVRAAAGLKYRDYFPDRYDPYSTPVGRAEAVYPYVDADGRPLFEVVRAWDATANSKWIRNRVVDPGEESGFRWNLNGIKARPLFRLPQVINAVQDGREIWIVEGEKDVLRLEGLGEVATCNHGGAGKWRPALNEYLRGATVNIVGDLDEPGVAHAWAVADSLQGVAGVVIVLAPKIEDSISIKEKHGEDVSDHFDAGGTLTDFRFLPPPEKGITQPPGNNRTDTKPALVESVVFRPPLLRDLVASLGDEVTESATWRLPGLAGNEVLTLLGGLPKQGKTTAAVYAASAVATGGSFWGVQAMQAPVLWLNLETTARLAARKFLDATTVDAPVYIWSGSTRDITLNTVAAFIQSEGIGLVVVDSLSRLWGIGDENDAVQVGRAVGEVLNLTRTADVATLLIHHYRKSSEGESVSAFRGSNSLTATVDIAIGIRKRGSDSGRRVALDSRYDETPKAMVVDIRDGVYVALGDERSVKHTELCEALVAALSAEPQPSKVLAEVVDKAETSVRRALDDLVEQGRARRTGDGKRGNPYLFGLPQDDSTTIGEGAGGTNSEEVVA